MAPLRSGRGVVLVPASERVPIHATEASLNQPPANRVPSRAAMQVKSAHVASLERFKRKIQVIAAEPRLVLASCPSRRALRPELRGARFILVSPVEKPCEWVALRR